MLTDLKVKVGPQVYRYHEGAIDYVPEVLKEYKVKRLPRRSTLGNFWLATNHQKFRGLEKNHGHRGFAL